MGSLGLLQKGKRMRYSKWAKGCERRCVTFIERINSLPHNAHIRKSRRLPPAQGKFQVHSIWTWLSDAQIPWVSQAEESKMMARDIFLQNKAKDKQLEPNIDTVDWISCLQRSRQRNHYLVTSSNLNLRTVSRGFGVTSIGNESVFHYLFTTVTNGSAERSRDSITPWLVPFSYSICILFFYPETYPESISVVDRGQYTSINAQKKLSHGDNSPLTHANAFPSLGRTLRRPNQQSKRISIRCQIYLLCREYFLVLYLDGLSWMGIIIYQLDCWSTRASQTGLVWSVVLESFF